MRITVPRMVQSRPAYKRRAFDTHPDRGGDAREFHRVQQAWDFLQDPHLGAKIWEAYQLRPAHRVTLRRYTFTNSTTAATTSATSTGFGGISFGVPAFARRT